MLEDVSAKKWRLNPARGQRRNFGKLNGREGCAEQRYISSMIVAARCEHRHRAVVLDTIRVRVNALVQFRGRTQRERPEKRARNEDREQTAPAII